MNKKYSKYLKEALYKWKHVMYNECDICKRYWIKKNIKTTTLLLAQIDENCTVIPDNTVQIVDAENKGFANSCAEANWCPVSIL